MPSSHVADTRPTLDSETQLPPAKGLISLLLKENEKVSDIFLSPMRPPEVRAKGHILPAGKSGIPAVVPEDTRAPADGAAATRNFQLLRFRVFLAPPGSLSGKYFSRRGSYAITLRAIPDPVLPSFEDLNLPPQFQKLVQLQGGPVIEV